MPSACVNGSCVITPVVCGNPNDKCDLTKCVGGSCVPGYVDCSKQTPPDPCSVLDTSTFASSGGCNPVTGSCQWKKKVCIPTGCENEVCNSSGLCQKVATAGCGAVGCNCGAGNACYSNRCDTANGNTCYSVAVNCSAYVADTCTTVNPCDNTTGCSYSTKDCSSVAAMDKCHLVVKDPTDPACCTQQPINCQGTNPCKSYSCDPAVGCVVTDLCIPPSDKCVQVTCTTTGCVTTHTDCTPPNACFSGACNSTDGTCSFKTKCDDHDACTTDSCQSGACVNTPMVCDDSNVCTNEQCVNGSCVSTKVVCDDHNPCTVDTCDTVKGCTYTPDNSSCIGDACHTSYCDVKLGCVQNAISCSVATSKCTDTVCLPFQGCVHLAKTCNVTNATACSLSTCDENKGSCHSHVLVCNAGIIDTAAIIGGVVTTATIVGIVIALAAVLGVGGGAYAYYQSSGVMTEPVTQSNPLYVDNKTQGYNPMYKVSQAEI
uniref:Uncharacterized protein n=1 Tax=Arcella intermedia TaxID=1963864 RepID=A0A6B2L2E5_9EUKA